MKYFDTRSVALLALLLLPLLAPAQLYVAPKFGINGLANIGGEAGFDFQFQTGYQIGAEIGTHWKEIIGFRAELSYANREFQQALQRVIEDQQGDDLLFREALDIENGTLEASGALLFTLGDGFELSVGPQLRYLLSSGADGEWDFMNIDSVRQVDYDYLDDDAGEGAYWAYNEKDGNYFNDLNLGLNLGLAFNLFKGLFVEIQTNYAFTDLINDYYLESGVDNVREFDFIVTASYRIPISTGKKKERNSWFPIPQE